MTDTSTLIPQLYRLTLDSGQGHTVDEFIVADSLEDVIVWARHLPRVNGWPADTTVEVAAFQPANVSRPGSYAEAVVVGVVTSTGVYKDC